MGHACPLVTVAEERRRIGQMHCDPSDVSESASGPSVGASAGATGTEACRAARHAGASPAGPAAVGVQAVVAAAVAGTARRRSASGKASSRAKVTGPGSLDLAASVVSASAEPESARCHCGPVGAAGLALVATHAWTAWGPHGRAGVSVALLVVVEHAR